MKRRSRIVGKVAKYVKLANILGASRTSAILARFTHGIIKEAFFCKKKLR